MPKIIKDLESRLIEEAKKQIEQSGYGNLTIRSVAQGCGVGVGTVYNYFSSKDALVATYMLEDWNRCFTVIQAVSTYSDAPESVVRCIYDQLLSYADLHRGIFRDEAAAAAFGGAFSRYHGLLRAQLAAPLRKFCDSDYAAEFIAEALLTWTMAGKAFDDIFGMIGKLF